MCVSILSLFHHGESQMKLTIILILTTLLGSLGCASTTHVRAPHNPPTTLQLIVTPAKTGTKIVVKELWTYSPLEAMPSKIPTKEMNFPPCKQGLCAYKIPLSGNQEMRASLFNLPEKDPFFGVTSVEGCTRASTCEQVGEGDELQFICAVSLN